MDIDFRSVYSIIELMSEIKKTYKGLTHKIEPKNFKFPQRTPIRKRRNPKRVRSFWL